MGGALTAHSEGEGKGTTMRFVVPLRVPANPSAGSTMTAFPPRTPSVTTSKMARVKSVEGLWALRESLNTSLGNSGANSARISISIPDTTATDTAADAVVAEAPATPVSVAASPLLHAPRCRVLVAEDDRLSQTLMRKLLPKMGFDPLVVDNGALALQAAIDAAPGGAHLSAVASTPCFVFSRCALACAQSMSSSSLICSALLARYRAPVGWPLTPLCDPAACR